MSRHPAGNRPPILAEALLSLVIRDREAREGVLGDLWEEYQEAVEARSHGYATGWYWWSTLRLALRYSLHATAQRRRSRDDRRVLPHSPGLGPASVREVKYAIRGLSRNLPLTLALTLTLGLGIGAATTLFAVFDAVVLRPIPFPDPEGLVWLSQITPRGVDFHVSQPDFVDFYNGSAASVDLAAIEEEAVRLMGKDGMEAATAAFTTSTLFRVLGVKPVVGRAFTPLEGRDGTEAGVVMLSHHLWFKDFAADPEIVGTTLHINERLFVVVGVMPAALEVLEDADVWLARAPSSQAPRDEHRLQVYGRLRPDANLADAREDVSLVAVRLSERYPATNQGWGVRLVPLTDVLVGPQVRLTTLTLLSAMGLLLLLIGANLTNLLMARTTVRRREFGVLSALGAGRGGIVRLLLAESLLLGLGAAVIGIAAASVLIPIVALQPELVPRMSEVAFDGKVLGFAAAAAAVEALVIGLGSAVPMARWQVRQTLSESGGGTPKSARRLRDALVIGQVAMAMTLLVAAGLLSKSFRQLQSVDAGFRTEGLMAVEIQLSPQHPRRDLPALYQQILEGLRGVNGIRAAAGTDMRYFDLSPRSFTELGRLDMAVEDYVTADWRVVTEEYFATAGVPLLAGRVFDHSGPGKGEPEVVIGEALAAMLWPESPAVGERIRWEGPEGPVTRVIGVVGDVSDVHPVLPQVASAYVTHLGVPRRSLTLLVRAESPPPDLMAAVRQQVRAVDPGATLSDLRPVEQQYAEVVALDRFLPHFMTVIAVIAVILAGLGVYALVSFTVARRGHEIGVRLAMGGRPEAIVHMLFRHGAALVTGGVLLGAMASLALSEILSALLFETPAIDLATYVPVAAFLAAVGLTATYVPSRRATDVDPSRILPA